MTRRFRWAYLLAVTGALIFVCGICVGQETKISKLGKYLTRSEATELDRNFLVLQIEEIQNAVNVLEELEVSNRIGVPSFHLNPKTNQIQVLVVVHGNWVDTASLEEVEQSLKSQAKGLVSSLKIQMRDISDSDVYVTFTKINIGKNEIVNNFAEYKNGELTIRAGRTP